MRMCPYNQHVAWPTFVFLSPGVCLSVYLSIWLLFCLSVCLFACCLSVCLSAYFFMSSCLQRMYACSHGTDIYTGIYLQYIYIYMIYTCTCIHTYIYRFPSHTHTRNPLNINTCLQIEHNVHANLDKEATSRVQIAPLPWGSDEDSKRLGKFDLVRGCVCFMLILCVHVPISLDLIGASVCLCA